MVEQWTEDPRVISSILISSTILQRGFLSAVRQTTVNCFFSLRSKLIHKIIWTRTYGFMNICPISRIGICSSLKTRVISEFESLIGYHYLCRISLMVKRDSATVKLRVRFSYLAPKFVCREWRTGSIRKDGELDKVLGDVVVRRLLIENG